jgi:hypothetical protein
MGLDHLTAGQLGARAGPAGAAATAASGSPGAGGAVAPSAGTAAAGASSAAGTSAGSAVGAAGSVAPGDGVLAVAAASNLGNFKISMNNFTRELAASIPFAGKRAGPEASAPSVSPALSTQSKVRSERLVARAGGWGAGGWNLSQACATGSPSQFQPLLARFGVRGPGRVPG